MKNWNEKMKQILEKKWFHILIIVVGAILISASIFHTELWFDESYTMGLMQHDFAQIIAIDSTDVHPVLYYLMLKTFMLIFGQSAIVARIFSIIPAIIVGILGYNHIRKDFGAKVGLTFSFLMYFLPFMPNYAMEIRMYTWTILFVTVSAIYAYRITKENKLKNWLIFAIVNLLAAHCHYYGLATVAIINGLLFLYILLNKKIKEEKTKKRYLIYFFIMAAIQILGYLPWLFVFVNQAKSVTQGYWIPLNLAETVIAPLGVQFHGSLGIMPAAIFTLLMYAYFIYQIICYKKQKQKLKIVGYCLLVHFILYFAMLIVSITIKPIMYYRYMVITSGIVVFALAYLMANSKTKIQKIITTIVVMIILGLSIYDNSIRILTNYDSNRGKEIQYLQEQYGENTILLYSDFFHGSNLAVQTPQYEWYKYQQEISDNLKPFEWIKTTLNGEFLENYHGKIIIVDHEGLELYKELQEKYELKELARKQFNIAYRSLIYHIVTVEK